MRFDIRGAAREQDPIASRDQLSQIQRGREGRYQQRQCASAYGDGVDVLLADQVEMVLSTKPAIGRNSDDGQPRHV
jgi:hypothetical protein